MAQRDGKLLWRLPAVRSHDQCASRGPWLPPYRKRVCGLDELTAKVAAGAIRCVSITIYRRRLQILELDANHDVDQQIRRETELEQRLCRRPKIGDGMLRDIEFTA